MARREAKGRVAAARVLDVLRHAQELCVTGAMTVQEWAEVIKHVHKATGTDDVVASPEYKSIVHFGGHIDAAEFHRACCFATKPIEAVVLCADGRKAQLLLMPESGEFRELRDATLYAKEKLCAATRFAGVQLNSAATQLLKREVCGDVLVADVAENVDEKGVFPVGGLARAFVDVREVDVVIAEDVEDTETNVTRFVVLAREPKMPPVPQNGDMVVTTFIFRVRNLPAALYKAMGGFATNGVNMTKLESYMEGGAFTATFFYAEVDGRPEDRNLALALDELKFFSERFEILGVYPADPFRDRGA